MLALLWFSQLGALALVAASPTRTIDRHHPLPSAPKRTQAPLGRLFERQDDGIFTTHISGEIITLPAANPPSSTEPSSQIPSPTPIVDPIICEWADGIRGVLQPNGDCSPDARNGDICTFRNGALGTVTTSASLSCVPTPTGPVLKPGDPCDLPLPTGVASTGGDGVVNANGECRCPDGSAPDNGVCGGPTTSDNCTMPDGSLGTLTGDPKTCTPKTCTTPEGTPGTVQANWTCKGKVCPSGQELDKDGKTCKNASVQCPSGQELDADGKTCKPICIKNGATGKLVNGACVYSGEECDLPDGSKGIWGKDLECDKKPVTGTECEVINGQKGVYENGMCTWKTTPPPNSICTGADGKQGKMTADGKCDVGGTVTPPKEQSTCTAGGEVGLTPKGVGVIVSGTCTVYTRPDGQTYFPPGTINPPQAAVEAAKSAAKGIPKWGIAVAAAGGAVVLVAVAVTISCQCEWDHERHKLRRKKNKKRRRREEEEEARRREEERRREEDRIRDDERKRISMLQMQQQSQPFLPTVGYTPPPPSGYAPQQY